MGRRSATNSLSMKNQVIFTYAGSTVSCYRRWLAMWKESSKLNTSQSACTIKYSGNSLMDDLLQGKDISKTMMTQVIQEVPRKVVEAILHDILIGESDRGNRREIRRVAVTRKCGSHRHHSPSWIDQRRTKVQVLESEARLRIYSSRSKTVSWAWWSRNQETKLTSRKASLTLTRGKGPTSSPQIRSRTRGIQIQCLILHHHHRSHPSLSQKRSLQTNKT